MAPSLNDGETVWTVAWPASLLRNGQRVVVQAERDLQIIKRVSALPDPATMTLSSDNPDTESTYCGTPMKRSRVRGLVIWPLQPRQAQPR